MSFFARILERPERGLVLLCGAQIAFWTLAPALSNTTPPLDVVEMYAWGRETVIATFKHPNLPGLILEYTRRMTGVAGWPAYLVAQIAIAITYWAVFALGRDLMDAKRALAGVLVLTGVYFFSWPSPEFNHNVLQMPFWALISLFLWRAVRDGKALQWAALGALAGFSLWAKYSSAVLLVPAGVWMLWDADARKRLATPGPYLALAIFLLCAAPQAIWLVQHDFAPLHYAERRASDGGPIAAIAFLATLIADHLPMALLLLCVGMFGKALGTAGALAGNESAKDAGPKTNWSAGGPAGPGFRYLLIMGLGPIALVFVGGLIGAGLRASWGAPMLNLSGLIVVALLSTRLNDARLTRLVVGAGVLIALTSGLYFGHMRYGAQFTDKPLKGNWPQASITRGLEATWREETGGAPLRIVSGDIWTAGLVGMSDPTPPSVLINGDLSISPWITEDMLHDYGALVVWRAGETPPALVTQSRGGEISHLSVRYPNAPKAAPLVLEYAIIEPGP